MNDKLARSGEESAAGEMVTAVFAEQQFQPEPYNTFRFGPFSYSTVIRRGETPEQALARAQDFLERHARALWPKVLADVRARMQEVQGRRPGQR